MTNLNMLNVKYSENSGMTRMFDERSRQGRVVRLTTRVVKQVTQGFFSVSVVIDERPTGFCDVTMVPTRDLWHAVG